MNSDRFRLVETEVSLASSPEAVFELLTVSWIGD
jgi:uncharacterized protein YndB with AHSA1/START domain